MGYSNYFLARTRDTGLDMATMAKVEFHSLAISSTRGTRGSSLLHTMYIFPIFGCFSWLTLL